ncbi:MAG: Arm DNA-binding domain-containing protein [Blautia sp.]|nr:Arm DNA-binding domain-containing protein [Blautia sp.]
MASIQKRGKKYAVVYSYEDSDGSKKQKWESFPTKKEALIRKAAIENELNSGTFIAPSDTTVEMFLKDFVELYGTKRWGSLCTQATRA